MPSSLTRRLVPAAAAVSAVLMLVTGCTGSTTPEKDAPTPAAATAEVEPAVAAIAPASGSLQGGDTITITGEGLDSVSRITVAGADATAITVVSDSEVTATVPRAANFQPAAASVEIFAGKTPVPAAAPLSFEYAVTTPVDAQLQYAYTHWQDYNLAEYGNFNPSGGDCVNFVSQTLMARGWEMTGDWYNKDAGADWTYSWIHVPTFDKWLRANQDRLGITELSIEQRDQVKPGDIVIFDWNLNNSHDHTQIVSAVEVVDGVTKIKMVGHNKDTDWRDFDETITIDHPDAYAHFWSLPL
ncbi:amidase domain-containing protein [Diaminobutyricimonas sp. TR449]|uniref:amidase domain-containing protein n=1 Tax=Diaminobutyricimonas sp. TR449 TaxID=2708076 RepID=UPI001FBADB6F|nr:amidase domain-containing protein [Diaminobutyricimonas sp. TR449]